MGYYFVAALFPLLASHIMMSSQDEKRNLQKQVLFAIIPMFLLVALRSNLIGADTLSYNNMFEVFAEYDWNQVFDESLRGFNYRHIEIGYVIYCKLIGYVTHNVAWFQIITAFFYLIVYGRLFYNLKEESFHAIFFFTTLGSYVFLFTGTRQNLAMCLCLLAFEAVKKKKLIVFMDLVGLAFTFHKSAILFLPVYFVYRRKLNGWNIFIDILVGIVLFANFDMFQSWFANSMNYNATVEYTGNGIIFFVLFTMLTVLSIICLVNYGTLSEYDVGIINLSIISNVIWALRLLSRTAERPALYYCFFSYALFSLGLARAKKKERSIYVVILCLMIASFILYMYRFTYNTTISPYHFFFE